MKCRLCKQEVGDFLSELENHLWVNHESLYRPQWSRRISKFILKENTSDNQKASSVGCSKP